MKMHTMCFNVEKKKKRYAALIHNYTITISMVHRLRIYILLRFGAITILYMTDRSKSSVMNA